MPRLITILLVAVAITLGSVLPNSADGRTRPKTWSFDANSGADFEAQAAEVRKEMGSDGRYGAISVDDRKAVEADLDQIEALLDAKDSPAKLNDQQQVDLINAQERINAVLTKNDGNRLICTMEPRTGTKFKEKVCITQSERDTIRRNSQKAFQDQLMKGAATMPPGD
ncbi:MAG: hypothetical protein J0H15_02425 [Xanthomonadales bacterium]|nr:hypothetical protein [Xanthomonadales bacterium]